MKFCPECGNAWNGSKFCSECGKDLRGYINKNQSKEMPKSEKNFETVTEINMFSPFEVSDNFDPLAAFDSIAKIGEQYSAERKAQTSIDALAAFEIEKLSNDKYMITALKNTSDLFINIPDCVQIIGEEAFYNCSIIEVTLPEGLIKIGVRAFANCSDLEKINFPKSLKIIEEEAFYGCGSLDVTSPKNIRIGKNAFAQNASDMRRMKEIKDWHNKGLELLRQNKNKEARTYLKKAGDAGLSSAIFLLGLSYWDDTEQATESNKSAIKIFEEAAKKNCDQAQIFLGTLYKEGCVVAKDEKIAFQWYSQAAENNNAEAQRLLAWCYVHGSGVEQDMEQGLNWMEKAAESGDMEAQFISGGILLALKKETEGVTHIREAAEQGYEPAYLPLAQSYYVGKGVEINYLEAAKWYQKAVENGNTDAMVKLGEMYLNGNGVSQDKEEAVRLFAKAAEEGYPAAQNKLGECYQNGDGVEENAKEAVKWYRKASNAGCSAASENIGHIYYWGLYDVDKNMDEALRWYKKAEKQAEVENQDKNIFERIIGI